VNALAVEPVSLDVEVEPLPSARAAQASSRQRVSGLWLQPPGARVCFVLAHGAGAGMDHPSMKTVAMELGARGMATLRYQFPYMERGSRRPDPPELCHATVRAAVGEATRRAPELALIAGGRSFGGRMTSQTQAKSPLPGVRGLAFLAFPLHPAGKPADERARHLSDITIPLLFLQGTRDELADLNLLRPLVERLGPRATLRLFEDADHSFHVPARTGRPASRTLRSSGFPPLRSGHKDSEVRAEMLDALVAWAAHLSP
jgi:predicted alpha/beta-hydrolase family hydrolase